MREKRSLGIMIRCYFDELTYRWYIYIDTAFYGCHAMSVFSKPGLYAVIIFVGLKVFSR